MTRGILLLTGWAAVALLGGCGDAYRLRNDHLYVKPTVAVMEFDSRAAFPLGWDLGGGMRDILVDRLVATRRFHVIERPELAAVLAELQLQNSGATRDHQRAEVGRLKNVQYLVKATITDFGHASRRSGFLGIGGLDVFGGGNRAVMGLTLYVVDVESGEIVCSEAIEESVRAGDLTVKAEYRDVSFGGTTFYRTPLGRATAKVLDKAVGRIAQHVAVRPWRPKIAKVAPDGRVILSGGADRGVAAGAVYEVLGPAEPVPDPDTGDVIGHVPGRGVARVRVDRVEPTYALARPILGRADELKVGQICRPVPAEETPAEAVQR